MDEVKIEVKSCRHKGLSVSLLHREDLLEIQNAMQFSDINHCDCWSFDVVPGLLMVLICELVIGNKFWVLVIKYYMPFLADSTTIFLVIPYLI